MSRQSQGSMSIIGAIAFGVFLVTIVALMVVGGYSFSPALFLALAVAVVVSVFLLIAFHRSPGKSEASRLTGRVSQRREEAGAGDTSAAAAASAGPAPEDTAPAPVMSSPAPAEPSPEPAPVEPREAETAVGTEPLRLEGPREGGPDDLKKIKGVGPKLEEELHKMGIYHLDQIASWTESEVAWMDENLVDFRGRVSRDDWVGQARQLAGGGETEFSRRVDDGEVYH